MTDLGLFPWDDDVLFEALPRDRNRVTFDVLARPRVHDSRVQGIGALSRFQAVGILLRVLALPDVAHRVIFTGLSELCDLFLGQVGVKIQVSLST